MSCHNKPNHSWPRAGYESALARSAGIREISTCNDCLATKITFHIDQADGSRKTKTSVVEPPQGV